MTQQIFFISDGTGITVENMGNSLLTQFKQLAFETHTIPYVNTEEKARQAVAKINAWCAQAGQKPVVFSTIINPKLRGIIATSEALLLDFFNVFIRPLETHFQVAALDQVGQAHSMNDEDAYKVRIDAINYALNCDDGLNCHHYQKADIVLIGVSRCGKTPTSLYLALQFGIFVANYPFTEDDRDFSVLPENLAQVKNKLFGLTIDPHRLHLIRSERRPNSVYANEATCVQQVAEVEALYQRAHIPYLSTSNRSIEEIATTILDKMSIKRRFY
jgi:[pyruvate, water dikinase]-phosphate phosphotransferase / [pyruvate, water dikinase] kinase